LKRYNSNKRYKIIIKAYLQVPYQHGFYKYTSHNQSMCKIILDRPELKNDDYLSKCIDPIIIKSMRSTFYDPCAKWEKFRIHILKKRKRKGSKKW